MEILICGYGNVGKHLYEEFKELKPDIYDPAYPEYSFCPTTGKYDIAFVCVPTEMRQDGACDTSIVEEVISYLQADVIVIRSTVPVGRTKLFAEKYGKNIVFSPEYYGTTIHSPNECDFLVLGGERASCDLVADLYHKVKPADFTIRFTDARTAELAKYMENCFLALKVTFCAEFFRFAENRGISYNELREIFVMDKRMGASHTYIDPNKPYYDSHCLNKDIPAFTAQCGTNEGQLMKEVYKINENQKASNRTDHFSSNK